MYLFIYAHFCLIKAIIGCFCCALRELILSKPYFDFFLTQRLTLVRWLNPWVYYLFISASVFFFFFLLSLCGLESFGIHPLNPKPLPPPPPPTPKAGLS